MNQAKLLLLTALLLTFTAVTAQQDKVKMDPTKKIGEGLKSELFNTECQGLLNEPSTDLKWRAVLTNKKIAHGHRSPDHDKIKKMKAEKLAEKLATSNKKNDGETISSRSSVLPVIGNNFLGNTNNGSSPLDNSIAISNGGWIVSVANTTIEYDDVNGNNSYFNDIASFINDPTITNVCDPVVIYDPSADRFVFFAQECSGNSANSFLLVFFSQTNNPNDGWLYYKLAGNPLNDGSSFDYPKLAISNNELFITGNLFNSSGTFNQALIYQINKGDGYNGGFLDWQYWYGIDGTPFTLCPVSYGQGDTYGPGIYLVATASAGSSTVKLYDLTDDISGSPTLDYYEVSRPAYSVAANCPQAGTACLLDNGDCRTLSGMYLDGKIHYVMTTDVGSGWNGLNYSRLDLNSGENQTSTFGNPGVFDYTYPSVVSFTNSPTNHSVMIGFGSVSSNINPEIRVVNCDNSMNWSSSTLVKGGDAFSCYTNPTEERWGDYTGTTRRHNSSSPSIWMNGMYGTTNNNWNTWISEVHGSAVSGIVEMEEEENLSVYPNPIAEVFNLEFELDDAIDIQIQLFDATGSIVKELYSGVSRIGINVFSFNKAYLSAGNYILNVKSNQKTIAHEKIIIID